MVFIHRAMFSSRNYDWLRLVLGFDRWQFKLSLWEGFYPRDRKSSGQTVTLGFLFCF